MPRRKTAASQALEAERVKLREKYQKERRKLVLDAGLKRIKDKFARRRKAIQDACKERIAKVDATEKVEVAKLRDRLGAR